MTPCHDEAVRIARGILAKPKKPFKMRALGKIFLLGAL
jgi:hypothetical protein